MNFEDISQDVDYLTCNDGKWRTRLGASINRIRRVDDKRYSQYGNLYKQYIESDTGGYIRCIDYSSNKKEVYIQPRVVRAEWVEGSAIVEANRRKRIANKLVTQEARDKARKDADDLKNRANAAGIPVSLGHSSGTYYYTLTAEQLSHLLDTHEAWFN